MKKSELMELIKNVENEGSIDGVLLKTDLYKSSTSLDNFKKLIDSDKDFKAFMDSEKDKHYSKALDTWKTNNLSKLVEAELLKKNPKLTEEQIRLQELEEKFEKLQKEKVKAEMTSKFKDVLIEKKIPSKMIDFLLASDEDVTNANISLFEESMKTYIEDGVKARIGESSYTPPKSKPKGKITWEQVVENPSLIKEYEKQ